ncbi:MAG: hypothetical protein E6R03_01110 [Hyphomicrobiaceae bacterium]|nr:MAG: hypothetical protein E6R03_01110 [Hyphomicrobiaceae bacterium]
MAFTNSNDYLTGRKPVPTAAGIEVVATRFDIALVAADLDLNDVGAVAILPAGHRLVEMVYDSDDLDTNGTPTIVASVGPVNAGETDLSATWASAISASQSGTSAQPVLTPAALRYSAATDTKIGIKFTAASATKAAGTVGLTLLYAPV